MNQKEVAEHLAERETREVLADPGALRALAEARESVRSGDVGYGVEAARALLSERRGRVRRNETSSG